MVDGSTDSIFFFFNDPATTEIYTLSLHDALPISGRTRGTRAPAGWWRSSRRRCRRDRKSTRLNSSHSQISYAVFCLKKKKKFTDTNTCLTLRTTWLHMCIHVSVHQIQH